MGGFFPPDDEKDSLGRGGLLICETCVGVPDYDCGSIYPNFPEKIFKVDGGSSTFSLYWAIVKMEWWGD